MSSNNNLSMISSIDHRENSFIKHRARLNPSPNTDPWCLFCRTNLKIKDLPYKYIFDKRHSLDRLIESRLGLELDATLPSAYLCYRCEKELQRMSWHDRTASGDMQSKLESNLHLWPPQSSLPAPGDGGTVSANKHATSDHRQLFTKDAVSSSTFESLESSANSDSVKMASRDKIEQKERQYQAEKAAEQEKDTEEDDDDDDDEEEEGEKEEEEEEEEGTLDDTTTYILYFTPSGTLETRLVSHETSWNPSRKRKRKKSRSSSRQVSEDSDKYSRLESSSFSQNSTFGDQFSLSAPNQPNKTDHTSGQGSGSNDLVPQEKNQEMDIPEPSTTRTSLVTTTRRWQPPSEKQEPESPLVAEDEEDSRESEEDALTTTTTTTTTTTMTTPKGTTQWTKTTIKTIWDNADEEEKMEELAVEVATPSTPLPSSTEAAVAAASAATKKAFSHSPDTRRRRREHRHPSIENNTEEYGVDHKQKKARSDEAKNNSYHGPNLDMDTTTKTTQYYDGSRMDSGQLRSFQSTGENLENISLYHGNYGGVTDGRDENERKAMSTEVDMQYKSPGNVQEEIEPSHNNRVFNARVLTERKDGRLQYYNDSNEKCTQSKLKGDDYYMTNEEKEVVGDYKENKEEKRERKERSDYEPSQHYQQDVDVCQAFPYLSPELQTSNYRSNAEIESSDKVDDGFRLNGDQKETIINSSLASVGYQSTEFSSGHPPDSYPDNKGENVKEHWSNTSTTNSYVQVDRGQMQKDEVKATTVGWTGQELTTNPVENDRNPEDSNPDRPGLTSDTNFTLEEVKETDEEMQSGDKGLHQFGDSTGSSRKHGGGQRGGNDSQAVSGTSSPSQTRRQGSKDSKSSGRHRKRRHKGRKFDRSRDNNTSSDRNPVVKIREKAEDSEKEFNCTHYEEQDTSTSAEKGDGATATAASVEHKEESVHPTEEWRGKVVETEGGATSGYFWTVTAVSSDIGVRGRRTPSPEIDHPELPYKLHTNDYRRSYYDDEDDDDDGSGESSSSSNNKYERDEKKLDEDNNNNNNNKSNNSNGGLCSVKRETARLADIDAIVTSTHDSLEANPAGGSRIGDHHRQGDSGENNNTAFSTLYQGQTFDFTELSPKSQELSYSSLPRWDNATDYKTQPNSDYIGSTLYTLQQNAPNAKLSSPVMDNQDDTNANGDANATCTDNATNNDEFNENENLMTTNDEPNNDTTTGEYSNDMNSNQADFGVDSNEDANLTATTSDTQWNEPNMDDLPNADLNETTATGDDYETQQKEFDAAGGNTSAQNEDITSSFNADETADKVELGTVNDVEVSDFEQAPSAGGWQGYQESGTGDGQMPSLNDEIAQADQNQNWNNTFDKENDEDSPKVDAWNPTGSASYWNQNEDNEIKECSQDDDNKELDNEKANGQVDTAEYDDDYNQNYKDDSVENSTSVVDVEKDFSDEKEQDMTDSRHDDSADDTCIQQDDAEGNASYEDDKPAETGFVGDNQNYSCETTEYGGDESATCNLEENNDTTEHGIDSENVVDNFEERTEEPEEDSGETQDTINDDKVEEVVNSEEMDMEYNMQQSPVDLGTSYTEDVKDDSYGPDVQQDGGFFCVDNTNVVDSDDQGNTFNQQGDEQETANVATDESSWQTTPSAQNDSMAKRPVDLHLANTIYKETSPTDDQGGDYEEGASVEISNIDNVISPTKEAVQSSPYDSPSQRKDEETEVETEGQDDGDNYKMGVMSGDETYQADETLQDFQEKGEMETESAADRSIYRIDEMNGDTTYQVDETLGEFHKEEEAENETLQEFQEQGEIEAGSSADRNIYRIDETCGGGTYEEEETVGGFHGEGESETENLGEFQGESVNALNVTSISAIGETDTEAEEVLMVHTETDEFPIVPEVRSSIQTMYDGGRSTFDDTQYTSIDSITNENSLSFDSRGSSSRGPVWGSLRDENEAEVEIEGMIVEETLIVPSVREGNDRFSYGYASMRSNAVETRGMLDSEGNLRAPVAVLESSDDLGETTFMYGPSEYDRASVNDNNTLADTSGAGSFLDVPDTTEQKRWDSFESSKNKPSTFGVESHVEHLRYGVRVRSGRAGRKTDLFFLKPNEKGLRFLLLK